MKKKIKLNKLTLKSFVTEELPKDANTIKGGFNTQNCFTAQAPCDTNYQCFLSRRSACESQNFASICCLNDESFMSNCCNDPVTNPL
ncbi:MAG: pinensin family lanthipeptide [Bacteroidota bacterium]